MRSIPRVVSLTLAPSEAAKAKARAKPPKTPSKPPSTNKESTSPTNAEPASDFVGARWQKLAPSKPTVGQEMEHAGLAAALASGQLTFTEDELGALGGLLNEVRRDDFIRADDNYYYKPADRSMHGVPSRLGAIVSAKTLAARAAKEERKRMAEERRAAEASAWMAEWSKWLGGLDLPKLILDALRMPRDAGEQAAFEYMRGLTRDRVTALLEEARLGGLADVLMDGLEKLHAQSAPSGSALNEKFQQSGKFTMGYGTLDVFFGGLETLLGPPIMVKDPDAPDGGATLLMGMKSEHCLQKDSDESFTSSNGVTTTSEIEWRFAHAPDMSGATDYPERVGFKQDHPGWCRSPKPMDELMEMLEVQANAKLRKEGHNELMLEEVLAGRLYTGPMYQKYNAVLRACTNDPYLVECAKKICKSNTYATTIHAINSAVIKLSKLTKAGKVYRGVCYGKLPHQFWKADESGVKGGIEFGFQSTTRERAQAVHYAQGGGWAKEGDAMTVMEFQMGMIDRGADLSWLSQYPHEREVLLPPLTGVEALSSDVEGEMLVVSSRLSLNLSAQTLEQVLSRRRKMLMDMAKGIELEIREALASSDHLITSALAVLRNALKYGALAQSPEWYNNDDNFAKVMNTCLYLQRTILTEIAKLHHALDKPDLCLSRWKATGPARITLLAGWMLTRTTARDVAIDLQHANLTPEDGKELAELMRRVPKLTSIDVRGNESLGDEGATALIEWLKVDKATGSHTLRSLNGVCPAQSHISVPRQGIAPIELRIMCAELETNIFAEGVSAGMGGKGGAGVTVLNRRGHAGVGEWQPLIWAAKDNNLQVATKLIDTGTDVNLAEPSDDKSGSCYTALHWAALRSFADMAALLLKRKANMHIADKHGNTPLALAEKKGNKEIIKLLKPKPAWDDEN